MSNNIKYEVHWSSIELPDVKISSPKKMEQKLQANENVKSIETLSKMHKASIQKQKKLFLDFAKKQLTLMKKYE